MSAFSSSSRAPRPAIHGWIALDKPLGLTSTQALGRTRRLLGGKKAGHGGTLDPLATGLLPLAFGEATKLIPYIMDGDKEYIFTVQWGEQRATGDAEGAVTATSAHRPTDAAIRAALPQFIGIIDQRPPAFSAIKIDGERAYDLARAGEIVDLPPREVAIHSLDLLDRPSPDRATFQVVCGKGMYVRSLAQDLAMAVGTVGHVAGLRRTRVGPFTITGATTLDTLESLQGEGRAGDALLPLDAALGSVPVLRLSPAEAHALRAGQQVLIRPAHGELYKESLIFAEQQGVPVALVEAVAGEFRVLRGFHFG